jgi:hypothetical protein
MSFAPSSICLLLLGLTGCGADLEMLSARTGPMAAEAVTEARPLLTAGVGFAALAAAFCGLGDTAWRNAPETLDAPGDIAAWLGIQPAGMLEVNQETGQRSLLFEGGPFEAHGLRLLVVTPTREFRVEALDAQEESLASAPLRSTRCDDEARVFEGSVERGADRVVLPAGTDVEGVILDGATPVPTAGDLVWYGSPSYGRASLVLDDASHAARQGEGLRWPGVVATRGFSADVELELP